MKKMLITGLSSHLGGTEKYICDFVNRYQNDFAFSFLIDSQKKPCFYDEFSQKGYPFYFIHPRGKNPLQCFRDLRNLFRKERFDICFVNANTLSICYLIRFAIRYVPNVTVMGHSASCKSRSVVTKLLHAYGKIRLRNAPVVRVACSKAAGKFMFGQSPFRVVYNGIPLKDFYYSQSLRTEYRKKYHLQEKKVFIHVGAFNPIKNQAFLLEVFAEYYPHHPNSCLVLVGDGATLPALQQKAIRLGIGDAVWFPGSRADICALLNMSDVFLFPSLFEGFGLSIPEAVATGLPALVSDRITKEIALDGYTAFLPIGAKHTALWVAKMEQTEPADREKGNRYLQERHYDAAECLDAMKEVFSVQKPAPTV